MGVRGRRRELGETEDSEEDYVEDGYVSDDGGPSKFVPASLVESDTDDILTDLCENYRRKTEYLRYICVGDLRLWVSRYYRYPTQNANLSPILNEFLDNALSILENEQYVPCSENLPDMPNCSRNKLLGSLRYQLCQKLSKYYVPPKDPIRVPQFY